MTDAPPAAPSARLLLPALGFANFVVGMGAFVVIGVLSPVAKAFAVSQAQAAWLLTAYALVYAFSSPILVAATGQLDRARILVIGLGIFLLGAALASLAPSFEWLLMARAVMAVGGGLVTPVTPSVGIAVVAPAQRGRALATVFGGLTIAQVVGVPAGAWLGYTLGWHAAFVCVALLGLAAVLVLHRLVPRGLAVPRASLATLGQVLRSPRLMTAVSFTALFVGGLYTLYTFMAPLIESRLDLGRDGVTAMLLVFGAGAVAGNAFGGWLTDRLSTTYALALLCAAQVLLMPALSYGASTVHIFGTLTALWSICAWSFNVPQQARLALLDTQRAPVLFALNAAAIYLGGSLGSSIGGAVLSRAGFDPLGAAGAILAVAAAVTLWVVSRIKPA